MKDEFEEIDKMTDEELFAEMKSILDEVEEDEKVKDASVPEESFHVVFSQIREIEERRARENLSKRDKKLLEYGRRYERQLHFRKYWILAAVLVLVLAMGMTSVGGPERFFQRMIGNLSGRNQEMIDSSEGTVLSETLDEEAAYAAIEEKYGFYPVRLDYLPDGVVFEEIQIFEDIQEVKLFYSKNKKLSIQMIIYPSYREGSLGIDVEDGMTNTYIKTIGEIEFKINEYNVKSTLEQRWTALFSEKDITYFLMFFDMEFEEVADVLERIVCDL